MACAASPLDLDATIVASGKREALPTYRASTVSESRTAEEQNNFTTERFTQHRNQFYLHFALGECRRPSQGARNPSLHSRQWRNWSYATKDALDMTKANQALALEADLRRAHWKRLRAVILVHAARLVWHARKMDGKPEEAPFQMLRSRLTPGAPRCNRRQIRAAVDP